jgi:hypothetical protein
MTRLSAFAFIAVVGAGCDNLLKVDLPTSIPEESLGDPRMAQTLALSAQGDFECAFATYAGSAALYTDELVASTEFAADNALDSRVAGTSGGVDQGGGTCLNSRNALYGPLSTARFVADDAFKRLDAWTDQEVPGRNAMRASTALYAGYSLVMLGEGFCEIAIDLSPRMNSAAVFAQAEDRFTKAIAAATAAGSGSANIGNAALVGRARARLGMGKKAEAAADARLVPTGFQFNATFSSTNTRRENYLNVHIYRNLFWSVDARLRGVMINGAPDPRILTTNQNRFGPDGFTPLWFPAKYPTAATPIRLASWREAQLIIAEVEGGNSVSVERINAVRATYGIAPYAGGTPAQVMAQLVVERQREFFLEGQRLGDMVRLNLPWDTGRNHKNNFNLGPSGCIPLPSQEKENNPNIG